MIADFLKLVTIFRTLTDFSAVRSYYYQNGKEVSFTTPVLTLMRIREAPPQWKKITVTLVIIPQHNSTMAVKSTTAKKKRNTVKSVTVNTKSSNSNAIKSVV